MKWFGKIRYRISTEREYDMKRLLTLILAVSPLCAADLTITLEYTPQPAYNPEYTAVMPVVADQTDQIATAAFDPIEPAGPDAEASAPLLLQDAVVEADRPETEQVFYGPQNRPEEETAVELEQIIQEAGFLDGLLNGAQLVGGSAGAVALLQLAFTKYDRELILKNIPISLTIASITSMLAYGAAQNESVTTSLFGKIKNCFRSGYSKGLMASSSMLGLLGFCLLKCS
jgi:hypothetical protein